MKKNNKGFTLVELIATVSILALIVIIAIPAYNSVTNSVNEKNETTIREKILASAVKYAADNNLKNNYTVSVTNLITSGYIAADSYQTNEDGTKTSVITNPTNESDNLACHEVTITVEDYEYYANFTTETNESGEETESYNCDIATSIVSDSYYTVKAYKASKDSSGKVTIKPGEIGQENQITNTLNWSNEDVLVVVSTTESTYDISKVSFASDTDTRTKSSGTMLTNISSDSNTEINYEDYLNVLYVSSSSVLSQDWNVQITSTENNQTKLREKNFTIQIDKEKPTVEINKESGWVSQTSGMLITGSDGAGSGVSKILYWAGDKTSNNTKETTIQDGLNSATVQLDTNNLDKTQNFVVVDKAGNESSTYTTTVNNIDKENPVVNNISYSFTNNGGIYDQSRTIKIATSDSESGISKVLVCQVSDSNKSKSCTPTTEAKYVNENGVETYNYDFVSDKNDSSICYKILDNVGNEVSGCESDKWFKVDTTSPSTPSITFDGINTYTVSSTDNESSIKKYVCNNGVETKDAVDGKCQFEAMEANKTYKFTVTAYNNANETSTNTLEQTTKVTVENAYNRCNTNEESYCDQPIYMKYGSYNFVIYNKDQDAVKIILKDAIYSRSLVMAYCCDQGYCSFSYTYDGNQSGIYGTRGNSSVAGYSSCTDSTMYENLWSKLPSDRTSKLKQIKYNFNQVSQYNFSNYFTSSNSMQYLSSPSASKTAYYGLMEYSEYATLRQRPWFTNLNITTLLTTSVSSAYYSSSTEHYAGSGSLVASIIATKDGYSTTTVMNYGSANMAMVLSVVPSDVLTGGNGTSSNPYIIG